MDVLIAPRVDAERILCKYVKRLRVWFNGRTFGCQSNDPGSIPGTRTRQECASESSPPRFARRLARIAFSGSFRICRFAENGSSRWFSEMLSFRKNHSASAVSRLDSRTKRIHEPDRAKTLRWS